MNTSNHLKISSRVQTTVGLPRVGTVVAVHPPRDPRDPPRLDIRWDDARQEVCTGVSGGYVKASSVIDTLAGLVTEPRPAPAPRRSVPALFLGDLESVSSSGLLPECGRLALGFALLNGDGDYGAWW